MSFSPTIMGTGVAGYAFLTRTRAAQQATLAKSAVVARDTQNFVDKLKDIQTSDQLMDDYGMLKVALGAFGLDEDISNRAFIKKILDSDLADGESLANRLADKRYLALAKAFNFAGSGPSAEYAKSAADVTQALADIQSADDLLNDPSLLRATLKTFGLEADRQNTYFLKQVLNSDLTDSASFANRLSNPAYAQLAGALDLAAKTPAQDTIYGFAKLFSDKAADIKTADDLLGAPDLLAATLTIFGLQDDADRPDFLASVLNSDLTSATSLANTLDDKRYLSLAGAFDFAARAVAEDSGDSFTSSLEKFVTTVSSRTEQLKTPSDLTKDFRLMLDTFDFFGLPNRTDQAQFTNRILDSDPDSPTSLVNVFPDLRYKAFANAFRFPDPEVTRSYPPGFAETVVQNYLDRQFEIQVGEADTSMRLALSFDRDLQQVVESATSNTSRWYGVLASSPLREVFETVFQLPESFASLDIDRQADDFRLRAEQLFGTSKVSDLLDSDTLENIRHLYLVHSNLTAQDSATSSASLILTLLGAG